MQNTARFVVLISSLLLLGTCAHAAKEAAETHVQNFQTKMEDSEKRRVFCQKFREKIEGFAKAYKKTFEYALSHSTHLRREWDEKCKDYVA